MPNLDFLDIPGPCVNLWHEVLPPAARKLLRTIPQSYVFSLYPVNQAHAQRALIDQVAGAMYWCGGDARAEVDHIGDAWSNSALPSLSSLRYLLHRMDRPALSLVLAVERFVGGVSGEVVVANDQVISFDRWLDIPQEVAVEYEMLRLMVSIVAAHWTRDKEWDFTPLELYQLENTVTCFLALLVVPEDAEVES